MKIAIIGSRGYPYIYSGYETLVKELSENLAQEYGAKITVYCHKNLFKGQPARVNNINLVYIYTIERKTLSQFIHSLQSILHACFQDYDVILVLNSANGPFGIFTRIFKKKTAINVDGLEWLRPKWKGLGARYFYWASRMATKLYDVIITDSFEMQKIYEREFNAKSTVIAYGAKIRYSKTSQMIERWSLAKENYYLIVSRLIPDNNTGIIIKEFIKSNSARKLVIVGDDPFRDRYVREIKSNDDKRLIFTGFIREEDTLAELYHSCFAYFHGHEYGGTNPSMLQALACGCAVIALDTVFNKEMLKNDKYGFFFNKNNGNLKGLIEQIESKPDILNSYKMKSRERIKENYTWEKIVKEYIYLFNKLMVY